MPNAKHVLGVSGGADSMVLLAILRKLKIPVIAVHFNYNLRETDADLDHELVEDFCTKNSIPIFIKRENAANYASEKKIGIQEAARKMRYNFFREIMREHGATKIITAHHADDQVETMLLNLLRASGIKGLAGMPVAENDILRPMITIAKEEIYAYAKQNNIVYREDASNASDKYQRNFLRNITIPAMEERFPNARESMLKSASYLREATLIYEQRIEQLKKKLLEKKYPKADVDTWQLSIRKLKNITPLQTVLYELFVQFGLAQNQLSELVKLIDAANGARLDLENYTIYKDRNFLLIQPNNALVSPEVFIEKEKGSINLLNGKFSWQFFNEPIQSAKFDKNIATVDAKNLTLPFHIRAPRQGDYFYPLGMKKKKKLSRFFIDNKYSPLDKERALLVEMDKKIVWLVGQRIDDRFRISENTTSYYKFTFKPNE